MNRPLLRQTDEIRRRRPVYSVAADYLVEFRVDGGYIRIVVPERFESNLASIPWLLWPIFPPHGRYDAAALVHDFLYRKKCRVSRFLADAIFRELMAHLGVPRWRRVCMFYAVRWFGWRSFKK